LVGGGGVAVKTSAPGSFTAPLPNRITIPARATNTMTAITIACRLRPLPCINKAP